MTDKPKHIIIDTGLEPSVFNLHLAELKKRHPEANIITIDEAKDQKEQLGENKKDKTKKGSNHDHINFQRKKTNNTIHIHS